MQTRWVILMFGELFGELVVARRDLDYLSTAYAIKDL